MLGVRRSRAKAAQRNYYIEECLWRERERNGEEGPTTSNSTLMRIADLYSEDRNNHPVFFMITIDLDF